MNRPFIADCAALALVIALLIAYYTEIVPHHTAAQLREMQHVQR